MKRRPLTPVLLAATVILLALNCVLVPWSHRLPYYRKLESVRVSRDPDLLFVGNSLLDHRVDASAFETAGAESGKHWTIVNSALGATLAPEQRLLFQYAKATHPGISTVVIGFYDFQLTAADHSSVADLTGNRMVGVDHRFPISETSEAYRFGLKDRVELELLRFIPMAAYRASAWRNVEILRRKMASVGMPPVATNGMGRVEDFTALEADSTQQFDSQAQAFLANEHFNASFEAVFAQARSSNMRVVLLAMPMSPYHLRRFYSRPLWSAYFSALKDLAASRGIQVIDASQWMPAETDFADHLHLSEKVVPEFSVRLAQALQHSHLSQAEPPASPPSFVAWSATGSHSARAAKNGKAA